jgi:hypothetical protein
VPLDPLSIRVVLAPYELGPYNRSTGYYKDAGEQDFILGNRHHCRFNAVGDLELRDVQRLTDFIVHELTHARQAQLMKANGWMFGSRGVHRDRGWYTAISEAAPRYLNVEVPEALWPKGQRAQKGRLTETALTHWPASIRDLVEAKDPRLELPPAPRRRAA